MKTVLVTMTILVIKELEIWIFWTDLSNVKTLILLDGLHKPKMYNKLLIS